MEMGKASAGSSDCASSTEDVSVGFKSCFQCCFHLEEPLWSQTKACLHGLPNLTFLPPPLRQWPQQPESVLPADICRLVLEFPKLTRRPPLSPSVGLTFWLQLWAATSATEVLNMTQLGKGFQTLPLLGGPLGSPSLWVYQVCPVASRTIWSNSPQVISWQLRSFLYFSVSKWWSHSTDDTTTKLAVSLWPELYFLFQHDLCGKSTISTI